MRGWGGKWDGRRELFRGLFHSSAGLAAWFLLQIVGVSLATVGWLLFTIGPIVWVLDWYRVKVVNVKREGQRFVLSQWLAQYLFRETEKNRPSNVLVSLSGLGLAWVVCTLVDAPWIAAGTGLIFATVDPCAKFGMYWPIKVIAWGPARGKSWGGFLSGLGAGLIATTLIVLLPREQFPLLPATVSPIFAYLILAIATVVASWAELISGKYDNLLIPTSAALTMSLLVSVGG